MLKIKATILFGLFFASAVQAVEISLDDIARAALQTTNTANLIRSQKDLSRSFYLQSDAAYDWNFETQAQYIDNRNKPSSPFAPNLIRSTGLGLGLNKYWSSGTSLGLKMESSRNVTEFPPSSNIVVPEYYESIASIGISQNLLRDAFGSAGRHLSKSLKFQSQKTELQSKQDLADYTVSVIGQFFQAWLAEQNLVTAGKNLESKNKLFKSADLKYKMGAGEKTELLQAESAKLLAETNLLQAKEELAKNWRELVIRMGLSDEYLQIPVESIKLKYSSLPTNYKQACSNVVEPESTNQVKIAKYEYQAAELQQNSVKMKTRPELTLNASLTTNGVRSELNPSQQDSYTDRHPNWYVGLKFSHALGDSAGEADRIQNRINVMQKKVNLESALENQKINLKKMCADLENLEINIEKLKIVFQKQEERSQIENSQFRLGRTRALSVIQAADDAQFAELNYKKALAEKELALWGILNTNNEIQTYVKAWSGEVSND